VPAHDEFAVWQSFSPAFAMPKHFSAWNFGVGAGPPLGDRHEGHR